MKLTEQRISHLSHLVLNALCEQQMIELSGRAEALAALKSSLERQVSHSDAIDTFIREKLRKQCKVPGSREWQILYDKYFQEERGKKGWS